jgi:phosphoribosylanthranilate isomerase
VGVFVNETEANMLAIARRVGLDYLQLHGDEPPDQVARLKREIPVIKAVRVRDSFRPKQLDSFGRVSAILLDGFDPRRHGGTGKTFKWSLAHGSSGSRIFLAGGLTPDNVGEAIRVAHPYAVDVCSGVEVRPGRKDPARIVALMWAVKTAEAKHK